jgi:metal-responsive CopG/Arc/MetJ family transcriptional regulator
MPTKNPRINVVLDQPLYELIEQMAERKGVSLSLVTRDLIKEALEIEEDVALGYLAAEREATYDADTTLSHEDVWE